MIRTFLTVTNFLIYPPTHNYKLILCIFSIQVTKASVDNYKPRKLIPHCELSAEFESDIAEPRVTPLRYQLKLLGAKEPYNMFTIKPPLTGIGNVTHRSSLDESLPTKRPLPMSSQALGTLLGFYFLPLAYCFMQCVQCLYRKEHTLAQTINHNYKVC